MAGEDKKDEKKSKKDMDVEAKINDIMGGEGGKVVKMEVDYSESVAKKVRIINLGPWFNQPFSRKVS